MRRISFVCLVLLAALLLPATSRAAAPTVTLSSPADGALITTGQPSFSGSAGDAPADTGQVAISVYSGTDATGVPVEAVDAPVHDNSFSASSTGLADGTYTAVASESDTSGNAGSSQPVTFQLFNGTPKLTLVAPAAPILTPAPTFTGTAQTGYGDAASVEVTVYPGSSTDATPLEMVSAPVASGGGFSIQITPGLADGSYTAVASQALALTTTFSKAVPFTITSRAPALSITAPTANASEPQTGLDFAGAAGDAYGDDSQVSVSVYAGTKATGTPLGSATVTRNGAGWSEHWPDNLALGTYTLAVSQSDSAGQTTQLSRSFRVLAPGSVRSAVTISAAGRLSARLACLAGAGTCNGDVLIVTATRMTTTYGGPRGPLALMFDHYSVPAGHSALLTARLSPAQLRVLRASRGSRLRVTVAYPLGAKLTETSHLTGTVRVAVAPVRPRGKRAA